MVKIGIVTIMDYTNFGNRLQNYAVFKYLNDRKSCEVKTLMALNDARFYNHQFDIWVKNRIIRILDVIPGFVEKRFGARIARSVNFDKWSSRIPVERLYSTSVIPQKMNEQYDLFFVGSDQVWNCNFPAFREYDYFLKFADNSKKASLSASFGFESIPDGKQSLFSRELKKFRYISVREKAAADIVKTVTGRDVPVLVDPVMMIDQNEWEKVMNKPGVDINCKYVLKYYLGETGSDSVDQWANENGYKVYNLLDDKNPKLYAAGPGEFLSLIKNASLVCSDSFHCIAFSILFEVPFIVFSRSGKENYMSSRLQTLLEKFHFETRWSSIVGEKDYLNCDFSSVGDLLKCERKAFDAYVDTVLNNISKKKTVPELAAHNECTGCGACASVCPVNSIQMKGDKDDFLYPEFVDADHCLHCGQCTRVCPVINNAELKHPLPESYAVISKHEDIRIESSSGGMFSEVANYVIEHNGIVFGAGYDDEFQVIHVAAETKEELGKLRGAKYSQSFLGDTFDQVKNQLRTGRLVLFSGAPCQVAGLRSFIQKDYDNLICLDFVCHGIPSPMVWREYVKFRANEDNNGKLPCQINLRSKTSGWSKYKYSNLFVYENKEYSSISSDNSYMNLFVGDSINRESCANCKFKGYIRNSDITIGDFWGIWDIMPEMDDNKGTSVVLLQSEKGKRIFNEICDNLHFTHVLLDETSSQNPSMVKVSKMNQNREYILENIRSHGYRDTVTLEMKNGR